MNSDSRSDAEKLTDPVVAQAYRDLANERAPRALDQAVLRKARAASGFYGASARWIRPLAWAATAILSLGLVLHFGDLPEATVPVSFEPGDAVTALHEAADRAAQSKLDAKPPDALPRAQQSLRADDNTQAAAAGPNALHERPAKQSPDRAFRVLEAPIIDDAAKLARVRQAPLGDERRDAGDIAAARLATRSDIDTVDGNACSTAETATAARWLDCIDGLKSRGLDAAALVEQDKLRTAFPGSTLPATTE